jgi:hypothetical protein
MPIFQYTNIIFATANHVNLYLLFENKHYFRYNEPTLVRGPRVRFVSNECGRESNECGRESNERRGIQQYTWKM